jgi:hypothetical protein
MTNHRVGYQFLVILLLTLISFTACSPRSSDQEIQPSPTKITKPTAPSTATSTWTAVPNTPVPATSTWTAVPDTPVPATSIPSLDPTPLPIKVNNARDILGLWHGEGRDGMYFKFDSDGTCQQTQVRDTLDANPNVTCEFRFEGDQFILTTIKVERLPPCEQVIVVYEIHKLKNGNIEFINIDDRCKPRVSSTAVEHIPIR